MKKLYKLLFSSILSLGLCFALIQIAFATNNSNFEFRIQAYQNNSSTAYSLYRNVAVDNYSTPWMVNMTYSQEGTGTITSYWLELGDGTNVSPTVQAKAGNGEYKRSAYGTANSKYVFLTAENNNNNSQMYTVKGYWNPVSSY